MPGPLRPKGLVHLGPQLLLEGLDHLFCTIVELERLDMFIEITRAARPDAQGVHFRPGQTIEIVELHGGERMAQVDKFFWRFVELSALVIRTDDEDAQVASARGL